MKHINMKEKIIERINKCQTYDVLTFIVAEILNSNIKELNNLEIEKKIINKASELKENNDIITDALILNIKY